MYVTVKGQRQGVFKGPGSGAQKGRIPILSFEYEIVSQRDAASGLPSGKREHLPVVFRKEIDASSPQFFEAEATNENLTQVQFVFAKVSSDGKETVVYKVELTNGAVVRFRQFVQVGERGGPVVDSRPLDEISLVYQKIEVTYVPGNVSAGDDWQATI